MSNHGEHTYTQLLVICTLAHVVGKDAPWWTIPAIILVCWMLATLVGVVTEKIKGE